MLQPSKEPQRRIKVLIVDDSALIRKLLTRCLQSDPAIEVVGAARDAYMARDMIKRINPDVLTLDIEMPGMDGLSFLKNLMRLRPMPVVMVSSLTERGAEVTLRALDYGAVDFVRKPKVDLEHGMQRCADDLIRKVKAAAIAKVSALARIASQTDHDVHQKPAAKPKPTNACRASNQIIAIGASTGGTEAVKEVLMGLRPDAPGIVITQHIPPMFSRSFAERMDRCSALAVCEAEDGQVIHVGHVFIAPGDRHLRVVRDGAKFRCRLSNEAAVNHHRPSVDVLFESVVTSAGSNAIGVILTGMGSDGAKGLRQMLDSGAHTLVQDEASSVVWGMPRVAFELGAAKEVLPLTEVAKTLNTLTKVG